jgi:hypothetical protein
MQKRIITGIIFLITVFTFSARAAVSISGKIIEESTQTPLAYANILLLSLPDSAFVSGTTSSEGGLFQFDKVNNGKYLLKVLYIGFETKLITVDVAANPVDLGNISLKESNVLREVVITSKTPPFQSGNNGGLIANVSTTLLSTVGTANDVLQRMPGIILEDGKIKVFGKGAPVVYINNRKVRDNQELERLESSEISTVELITNPGAKYDAEGRSVLLIKTKSKSDGFSAQVMERIRQGNHLGDNENVSVSYTKNNANFFASYYHQYRKSDAEENHHILVNSDTIWKHDLSMPSYINTNHTQQVSAGLDWTLNKKQAVGVQYQLYTRKYEVPIEINALTYLNEDIYDELFSKTITKESPRQHLVNAFYTGDFSDRFSLRFDFDYLKTHNNKDQFTEESSNLENRTINTFSKTDYDMYAGKLVNSYQSEIGLIEFGGEYNNIAGSGYVLNPENYTDNNIFTNKEQKAAAFINYSQSFGDIKFSAGLRYEFTHEEFTEDSIKTTIIDRTYHDIYPNISISKKIKNVDLSLVFNKRTRRPSFTEMNGNTIYVNRFLFQKGNPYLKKTNIYDMNFQTVFKMFYANLGYTYAKNPVNLFFREQELSRNAVLSTFENFPEHQEFNATLNFNSKISFWQPNYTVGICKPFFSTNYNGVKESFNKEDYFFKAYNDFTLPKSFVFSCNFRYQSDYNNCYIKTKGQKQIDLGVRKSLLDNKLKLNLEIYDIFNWVKEQYDMNLNDLFWNIDRKKETRYIQLSITYQFNNYSKKYRGKSAAQDDINRF